MPGLRRFLLPTLCTCALVSRALADAPALSDSLTVGECVARAREHAPEPRVLAAERIAAALDSSAIFRARRAAFSFQVGAMVAPHRFYDPAITNLGEYGLKLGVEAPLVDGGSRRRERERGALASGESRLRLEQGARDAGLLAGALAVEWLRLTETERTQIEAVAWLEHLAGVMESGVRAGVRGRADALRALLERDAAAAALDLTRRDLAATSRALTRAIGAGEPYRPAIRSESDSEVPPTDADSLALIAALEHAPEVRLAGLSEAQRRIDLDAARRGRSWQVGLAADAGLAGSDLTRIVPPDVTEAHPGATFSDRLRRDLGASVSLQLRRPLFDPSARDAAAARLAAVEAQHLRQDVELDAQRRLALDLVARWRSAALRLTLARDGAARADEHLLRLASLHAAGAATLLELLDARRALDDARERLADARAEARAARLESEERR